MCQIDEWEVPVDRCTVCGNPLQEHWRGRPCLTDRVDRFVRAWEVWLRNGKLGQAPQSEDYDGVLLSECDDRLEKVEGAIREETGLSCWHYYDPQYYRPMMQARRDAVQKGEDPDAAARSFHDRFTADSKTSRGTARIGRSGKHRTGVKGAAR